jgi:hypothetical protein
LVPVVLEGPPSTRLDRVLEPESYDFVLDPDKRIFLLILKEIAIYLDKGIFLLILEEVLIYPDKRIFLLILEEIITLEDPPDSISMYDYYIYSIPAI